MRDWLKKHLLSTAEPTYPIEVWVLQSLVRVNRPIAADATQEQRAALIYGAEASIRCVDNRALDEWNSCRSDMICEYIKIPDGCNFDDIDIPIEPGELDVSYWLCAHVLLIPDHVLLEACSLEAPELTSPQRAYLPLIKHGARILRGIEVGDPLVAAYHRSRYRVIRWYLNRELHETL